MCGCVYVNTGVHGGQKMSYAPELEVDYHEPPSVYARTQVLCKNTVYPYALSPFLSIMLYLDALFVICYLNMSTEQK